MSYIVLAVVLGSGFVIDMIFLFWSLLGILRFCVDLVCWVVFWRKFCSWRVVGRFLCSCYVSFCFCSFLMQGMCQGGFNSLRIFFSIQMSIISSVIFFVKSTAVNLQISTSITSSPGALLFLLLPGGGGGGVTIDFLFKSFLELSSAAFLEIFLQLPVEELSFSSS